jgi:predicted solute-binding protein
MKQQTNSVSLGISPCPSDTYIIHAIATEKRGLADHPIEPMLHDVETLNQTAMTGTLAVTKLMDLGPVGRAALKALNEHAGAAGVPGRSASCTPPWRRLDLLSIWQI